MKYNAAGYNEQRYNINGTVHAQSFADSTTPTEATHVADVLKALSESFTLTESLAFDAGAMFLDIILMDSAVTFYFSNKGLNDSVQLADWFSIRRYPFTNEWTN